MLDTSLIQGLEIILAVTVMAVVVSPVLCWILPDRIHTSETKNAA
ncbi:MAG: hypothetical protein AAGE59_37880 [Cyanobacteria bacterium P01_F01_bin.86]